MVILNFILDNYVILALFGTHILGLFVNFEERDHLTFLFMFYMFFSVVHYFHHVVATSDYKQNNYNTK